MRLISSLVKLVTGYIVLNGLEATGLPHDWRELGSVASNLSVCNISEAVNLNDTRTPTVTQTVITNIAVCVLIAYLSYEFNGAATHDSGTDKKLTGRMPRCTW